MSGMRDKMVALVRRVQDEICADLQSLDGADFREDTWERPGGGGGCTRVLEDTELFEKAGVNTSIVTGELSQEAVQAMRGGSGLSVTTHPRFFATGVSLVLHPKNPMAPTVHANYRYFEREGLTPDAPVVWWFGGGADLTPSYLFPEDATHFHQVHKTACDAHDPAYYPRFKAWCDDYFTITHRGESRGIGGIFFDDLRDRPADELFAFVSDAADAFLPSYMPILQRRLHMPFTPDQKAWQAIRRGRYVEFNLVYDRGTTFGLKTGGRIESILMSLPLTARWEYDQVPVPGSDEAALLEVLRVPRDWVK